jgi:hypothetical protein
MRDDTLEASVNYGDYKGTVAADHHDHRDLSELAAKYGIDADKYFVFGVNVHIGERHGEELAHTFVSILAVDTFVVKAASVDFIKEYIGQHDEVLPYVSFNIPATLEEVLLCFKRFNVVLANVNLTRVQKYQVT